MNDDLSRKTIMIMKGIWKVKNIDTYTNYSIVDLAALQKSFSKREFLTVAETGIWLGKSLSTVYRDIKNGSIVVDRTNGASGDYRINVRETKIKMRKQ